jgi:hypothetical protein
MGATYNINQGMFDDAANKLLMGGGFSNYQDASKFLQGHLQNAADSASANAQPNPQEQQSALLRMLNPQGRQPAMTMPGATTPWSPFQFAPTRY